MDVSDSVEPEIDADRLDYLIRDQLFTGIRGAGFDIERILDLMYHHDNGKSLAVEIGALEAVEGYLFTLDHMYRTVYYHHAVRAATRTLTSAIGRAAQLYRQGDKAIFPDLYGDGKSALAELIEKGNEIPLELYGRLGEYQVWHHLELWRRSKDVVLSDLADRVVTRRPFKSIEIRETSFQKQTGLMAAAKEQTRKLVAGADAETVDLYVIHDEPSRTAYKTYTWAPESNEESIWLMGDGVEAHPIENDQDSRIIEGLRTARFFPRLIVTAEVRDALREAHLI